MGVPYDLGINDVCWDVVMELETERVIKSCILVKRYREIMCFVLVFELKTCFEWGPLFLADVVLCLMA